MGTEPNGFTAKLAERFDTWSLYTSASWMEAFIDPGRLKTDMVATEDVNPPALLVTHEMPDGWNNTVYDNFSLAGATLGGDRSSWLPQMLLGARVGQRNTLSLRKDLKGQARIAALADVLGRLESRSGSIGYLYLSASDAADVIAASDRQYFPVLTEAGSTLTVPDGGFDAYLAALKSSHRSVVRRDIAGYRGTITTRRLGASDDQIATYGDLLANVQQRHGQPSSATAMEAYLRRCIRSGHPVVAFEAHSIAGLSGVGIGIEYRGVLWMRVVGLRYDGADGTEGAYPQVLIYGPLEYAIQRGLEVVDLGAGVSNAKRLRGATNIPLWSVFRPPAAAMPINEVLLYKSNLARAEQLGLTLDVYPGGARVVDL